MSNLYLILHKVRGEPAFDIAQPFCEAKGSPCQPLCGCWKDGRCAMEGEWIIPTSGHTAHPYRWWPMDDLQCISKAEVQEWNDIVQPQVEFVNGVPPDWPDHYPAPPSPTKAKEAVTGLLNLLGLGPNQDFKKRRFTP